MKAKSGFTLVEILIVVVILGILAAIVIPQFTQAGDEARENSCRADLQTVRSQIELYKIQHNDDLPGAFATTTFVEAMTETTNEAGDHTGTGFGPYLERMPTNPYNNLADVAEEAGTAALGGGNTGWHFDNSGAGAFSADTDAQTGW